MARKKSLYLTATLTKQEAQLLDALAAVIGDVGRSAAIRLLIRSTAPAKIQELKPVCQGKS